MEEPVMVNIRMIWITLIIIGKEPKEEEEPTMEISLLMILIRISSTATTGNLLPNAEQPGQTRIQQHY